MQSRSSLSCQAAQGRVPAGAGAGAAAHRFAVRLTPPGRGAVATVLAQAPDIVEIVAEFFVAAAGKELAEFPLQRIVFGHWVAQGEREDLVVCRTAANQIEIHCHGGQAASSRILESLRQRGLDEISWQQWLRCESQLAPLAAQARLALAEARTTRTAAILLDQERGLLEGALQGVISQLDRGNHDQAGERLDQLLGFADLGSHLTTPWKVVLVGRPNTGKSSLINALVGFQRALVFDQPGTTRDVVTATAVIDGWPVELVDTAGLRNTDNPIEQAGVSRARTQMQEADLILLVHDLQTPWGETEAAVQGEYPRCLVVHNKSDLVPAFVCPPGDVCSSAIASSGIDRLASAIAARLVPQPPPPQTPVPFTTCLIAQLRAARAAVTQADDQAARSILARCVSGS